MSLTSSDPCALRLMCWLVYRIKERLKSNTGNGGITSLLPENRYVQVDCIFRWSSPRQLQTYYRGYSPIKTQPIPKVVLSFWQQACLSVLDWFVYMFASKSWPVWCRSNKRTFLSTSYGTCYSKNQLHSRLLGTRCWCTFFVVGKNAVEDEIGVPRL